MKCANCPADALFEYRLTEDSSIFYCGKHLPRFLEERKRAGLLTITDKFVEAKKEMKKILVPNLEIDEPSEEEPKTKKKASKKKAE